MSDIEWWVEKQGADEMTEYTYRDTTWRAMLMGSEGWAVFAGPRMLASHLTEEQAHLIAAAPKLLEALEAIKAECFVRHSIEGPEKNVHNILEMSDKAIQNAEKGE